MILPSVGMSSLADRCFHDTPTSGPGPFGLTTVPVHYCSASKRRVLTLTVNIDAVHLGPCPPKRRDECYCERRSPGIPFGRDTFDRSPWLPSTPRRGHAQGRTGQRAVRGIGLTRTSQGRVPTGSLKTSTQSVNASAIVPRMTSSEARRVIAVRLNPADVDWLDGEALKADCTRSDVVRAAIALYIHATLEAESRDPSA